MTSIDPREVIDRLALQPHPEGGWYRETWRSAPGADGRSVGTAIYFLLGPGERSHWHRVDADEIWHHYAGGELELATWVEGGGLDTVRLGDDLATGARPQAVVPAGAWQAARPVDQAVLVGCTVAPGFRFEGFELAPPGWTPGD